MLDNWEGDGRIVFERDQANKSLSQSTWWLKCNEENNLKVEYNSLCTYASTQLLL
jgi:hypothetical protein